MGLLTIECGRPINRRTKEPDEQESWYVRLAIPVLDEDGAETSVIRAGFQRRIDAEIACKSLEECGVDWSGSYSEIHASVSTHGGKDWLKQIACEHLQW